MRPSLLLFLILTACVSGTRVVRPHVDDQDLALSSLTAGSIGCPPAEIRIAEYQSVFRRAGGVEQNEVNTWSASCRGKQFNCTGAHTTQCHETIARPAQASE